MTAPLDPTIRRRLEALDTITRRFLEEIEVLSPEARDFHPEPDSWSPLRVAQHLMIAEQKTVEAVRRHRAPEHRQRSRRTPGDHWRRFLLMLLVVRFGRRVRAPSRALEPVEPATFDDVKASWWAARGELRQLVESIPPQELDHDLFHHPFGGPLNIRQGLDFTIGHVRHHLRQLERIRRHERFPRTAAAPGVAAE